MLWLRIILCTILVQNFEKRNDLFGVSTEKSLGTAGEAGAPTRAYRPSISTVINVQYKPIYFGELLPDVVKPLLYSIKIFPVRRRF